MQDYPSRKLQLAWSAGKGFIKKNDYITEILFRSILSRQGERWQNFGEDAEDLTDTMLLCRESMVAEGFGKEITESFRAELERNGNHIFPITLDTLKKWQNSIPTDEASTTLLLIDDPTAVFVASSAKALGDFLEKQNLRVMNELEPIFCGFEYFAYGLIDEGIDYVKRLIEGFKEKGVQKIITLSGQSQYLFTTFAKKLELEVPFEVVSLLDSIESLNVGIPSYLYAGSFNLRYLHLQDQINGLVLNTEEKIIKNCPEFLPLLHGDKRMNILNIWQKPVGAEYKIYGMNQKVLDDIEKDAIEEIRKSDAKQIIVFEAYALKILQEKMLDKKVVYYLECLF